MPICSDCDSLTSYLHERVPPRSYTHKNVLEVLRTAPTCDLCNLIISVEFKWQDHDEPATGTISLYNTETYMCRLEELAKTNPEIFPPIKVSALQDVCARHSEIVLEIDFFGLRLGRIYLAVWKDTPCADLDTECGRHRKDYFSDHMFHTDPAENRWAQFAPCSTSDVAYRQCGMISNDDSTATLDYLESWLNACEWGHGGCAESFAGEWIDGLYPFESDAPLPRRILDVDTNLIKLIETKPGEKGYYIALSHCWGKPEYHPPKTKRANFESHLAGIPLSTLPKTFQDAVRITRHFGVQYLWIDSLCIVQDDKADWEREAANMGAVYEYARLTIAAAGARDCTEGCFVSERPDLRAVQEQLVEQRMMTSNREGNHFADPGVQRTSPPHPPQVAVLSKGMNGLPVTIHFGAVSWKMFPLGEPYYTPLGYRAWARQEWYLSRRMLFFTQAGISWKCRKSQFDERQRYYDMREKNEWEHLFQRYSDDEITYETDRLIALQGVVTQMSPTMEGTYHFGLWTHMPELLFWMMKGPQSNAKGPDAPSWSWASRIGSKFFWKTIPQFGLGHCQELLVQNGIQVDGAGTLKTTALILEVLTAPVSDEWIAAEHIPWRCNMVPESVLIYYAHPSGRPVHFLFDQGHPGNPIGLASLDDDLDLSTSRIFCMYVLMTPRLMKVVNEILPPVIDDGTGQHAGKQVEPLGAVLPLTPHCHVESTEPEQPNLTVGDTSSMGAPDSKPTVMSSEEGLSDESSTLSLLHVRESKGKGGEVEISPIGESDAIYWVLLVQEVGGERTHFRRIGTGLTSFIPQQLSAEYQDISII